MRAKFISLLFCLFVGLSICHAALPEGYMMVTNISALQDGDHVVLYAPTIYLGVTGWDGKYDATVAANGWAEYVVETTTGGVYLKDAAAGKYICNPSSTTFAYGETGGVCSLGNGFRFVCNSRYLCQSGSNYRFYTSYTGSYKPFFLYKVPVVAPAIAVPTLSPADGAVAANGSFTAPFLLTMSCATEGAQIYYTTDGTDPVSSESRVLYQSPLSISETTTIRAIATDGTDYSDEVKVTYILQKGYAESIAEFIAAAPTSAYELRLSEAQNAVIIGVKRSSEIYLQDNSGKGIVLRTNGLSLPAGAVSLGNQWTGTLFGTLGEFEGNPLFNTTQIGEDLQSTSAARPTPVIVSAINADTYQAYPLILVTIEDVVFTTENKIEKDGITYGYRDDFGILSGKTLPDDTTLCNFTGILTTYSGISYKLIPVLLSDIDTKGAKATLPTVSPLGGETQDEAVETEKVRIFPAENTIVLYNNSPYTIGFNAHITETCTALTLTAQRDFFIDNTITLWYKSPTPPITSTSSSTQSIPTPYKMIVDHQLVFLLNDGTIINAQGQKVH